MGDSFAADFSFSPGPSPGLSKRFSLWLEELDFVSGFLN